MSEPSRPDKVGAWNAQRLNDWREAVKRQFVHDAAVDAIFDLALAGLSARSAGEECKPVAWRLVDKATNEYHYFSKEPDLGVFAPTEYEITPLFLAHSAINGRTITLDQLDDIKEQCEQGLTFSPEHNCPATYALSAIWAELFAEDASPDRCVQPK